MLDLRSSLLLVAAGIAVVACGGKTQTPEPSVAETPCEWPGSLEPFDAAPSRDSCHAGRTFLSCQSSDNATTRICLSNDPAQCPGPNPTPGVTYTCENQCKATEFGAACGATGAASVVPPANCRSMWPSPSGIVYYCCSCTN